METKENIQVGSECIITSHENETLKQHMHVHTGEKPTPRPQCDNKAINADLSSEDSKLNAVTKENLPVSSECKTTSQENGTLKQHMHVHTGQKPASSPQCDNEAVNADLSSQDSILNVETKENLPVGSECKTTPQENGIRKQHMHAHTGQKPTSSPQCANEAVNADVSHLVKSIKDQSDKHPTHIGENAISNHIKHTGGKPCSICNLTYATENDFTEHTQAHQGLVPFNCLDCEYKTEDHPTFTQHLIHKAHMKSQVNGGTTRKLFAEALKKKHKP